MKIVKFYREIVNWYSLFHMIHGSEYCVIKEEMVFELSGFIQEILKLD